MDGRNFGVFRKLCGEQTLKNVVIMTNMWGRVTPEVGEARERELTTQFFKPAADKGAWFLRHLETVETARSVIRAILGNHPLSFKSRKSSSTNTRNFPGRRPVRRSVGPSTNTP